MVNKECDYHEHTVEDDTFFNVKVGLLLFISCSELFKRGHIQIF